MIVTKVVLSFLLITLLHLRGTSGHGMLMEPVGRSSAWRKNFNTPVNYDDNGLNCGGGHKSDPEYGGKCGECGDPYEKKRPRRNENGGYYGTGTIVRRYKSGQTIPVEFHLTANHKGYCTFALCPLLHPKIMETELCFERYPLKLSNGSDKFHVTPGTYFNTSVVLPEGLTCEHCVLRWHYRAGNNWGFCVPPKLHGLGCGPQEIFRSCSDIAISESEN